MKVFDYNQNQEIDLPEDKIPEAILNGNIGFEKGKKLTLLDPSGKRVEVDADQAKNYLSNKFELVPESKLLDDAQEAEFGDRPISAGVASLARGLSFGLSDQLLTKTGLVEPETLKQIEERNAVASTVGEVASLLVPLGEASAAVKGVSKLGRVVEGAAAKAIGEKVAGIGLRQIGEQASEGLVKAAVKRAIAQGAGSAVEGAFYGAGHLLSEEALGNADFNAESIISNVGIGSLLGGTAGFALGAGQVGAKRGMLKVKDTFKHAYNKAFPKSGDPADLLSSARGRFDLIFASPATKEKIFTGHNLDQDFADTIQKISNASEESVALIDKQMNLGVKSNIKVRNVRKKILADEGFFDARDAFKNAERNLIRALNPKESVQIADNMYNFNGTVKEAQEALKAAEKSLKAAQDEFAVASGAQKAPKSVLAKQANKVEAAKVRQIMDLRNEIKRHQLKLKKLYAKTEPFEAAEDVYDAHVMEVNSVEEALEQAKARLNQVRNPTPVEDPIMGGDLKNIDLLQEVDQAQFNLDDAQLIFERAQKNLARAKNPRTPKNIDTNAWPFQGAPGTFDLEKKIDDANFQLKVQNYLRKAEQLHDASNRSYAVLKSPKDLDPGPLAEMVKGNLGDARAIQEAQRLKVFSEQLKTYLDNGGKMTEEIMENLGNAIERIPDQGTGLNGAFQGPTGKLIAQAKPHLRTTWANARKQAVNPSNGLSPLPRLTKTEGFGIMEGMVAVNLADMVAGTIGKTLVAGAATLRAGKWLYDNPLVAANNLMHIEKATRTTRNWISGKVGAIFSKGLEVAPRMTVKAGLPYESAKITTKPEKNEPMPKSFARIQKDLDSMFATGNPQALIEENLGNLIEVAPKTAEALTLQTLRNLEYLHDRLPRPSAQPDIFGGPEPKVSFPEMVRFSRLFNLVMSPQWGIEEMLKGKLNLEEMAALRETSPQLMAMAQEQLLEAAGKQEKITYQQQQIIKRVLEQSDRNQNVLQIQNLFQGGDDNVSKGVNIKTSDLAQSSKARSTRGLT